MINSLANGKLNIKPEDRMKIEHTCENCYWYSESAFGKGVCDLIWIQCKNEYDVVGESHFSVSENSKCMKWESKDGH